MAPVTRAHGITGYNSPRSSPRGGRSSGQRALAAALHAGAAVAAGTGNPLAGAALEGVAMAVDQAPGQGTYNGAGVTQQHDKSVQWVAKRPKAKKKKRNADLKKILAGLAPQSMLRNSSITGVTSSPTAQQATYINLYSNYGEVDASLGDVGTRDLYSLFQANGAASSQIYHFLNARLDATIVNRADEPVELDIYEYMWLGDAVNTPGLYTYQATAAGQQANIGTSALTMQTRGATPFQFGLLTKSIKILKKSKFLLEAQQACTYQYMDPRYHRVYVSDVYSDTAANSFPYSRMTCGLIIVQKSVVGNSLNANITIGATRTYKFKIEETATVGAGGF